jgi:hypothetical protein
MDTAVPSEHDIVVDGLRLMRAFLKIADPKVRAEIIELAERRTGEMLPPKPSDEPFELDPRD